MLLRKCRQKCSRMLSTNEMPLIDFFSGLYHKVYFLTRLGGINDRHWYGLMPVSCTLIIKPIKRVTLV